jgi:hypothetical protein
MSSIILDLLREFILSLVIPSMSLVMRRRSRRVSALFLGRKGTATETDARELENGCGGTSSSKRGGESSVVEKKRGAASAAASIAAQAHVAEAACPICQEAIGTRTPDGIVEHWSMLPCGHRFGSYCIKHYLRVVADDRPACPVCRQPVYHLCGHPVMPTIVSPSVSKKNHEITPAADAQLYKMRFARCLYCTGQPRILEFAYGHTTPEEKPTSRVAAAFRWLRIFDLVSRRRTTSIRQDRRWRERSHSAERERGSELFRYSEDDQRPPPIDDNRGRQQSASNGDWQGPWIDPFPRPRDMEWEKWWIAQAPQGA